jgi:F-type H+-transporting ATPase subunit gamma
MATARDLNNKIASLQNMQKVMSAMNMIASTKLRKLLGKQAALEQFSTAVDAVGDAVAAVLNSAESKLAGSSKNDSRIHLIVIAADKGLCGSHNSSVLKTLAKTIEKEKKNGTAADVTCIGIRAATFCRRHDYEILHAIDSNERHISDTALREIAAELAKRLEKGEINKIILIHNHFVSTLVQQTRQVAIYPVKTAAADKKDGDEKEQKKATTVTETAPALEEFISPAAILYFYYRIKSGLSDSYLSEHAARMTAMENAKTNSEDLINRYGTIRNRARQTAITSELIEIVAGKEAMKS